MPLLGILSRHSRSEKNSYVDLAVSVLEAKGRSMHMSELLTNIEHERGLKLARNSVEASIARHVAKAKKLKIARVGRSLYGFSHWKQQPVDAEAFEMQTPLQQ